MSAPAMESRVLLYSRKGRAGQGRPQGPDGVLQHLGQGIRGGAGAAGETQCGVEAGADLVPSGEGLAQPELGGPHVGAPGQHIGRDAGRQRRDAPQSEGGGRVVQGAMALSKQQAQGIACLLPLQDEGGDLRLLARLLLAGLHQVEAGDCPGLVFGPGQPFDPRQVGELLVAQGNGRSEVGQLPVLLQGLADQQQPGGGEILLAGLCLPACLIPCCGQPAPEIHFVAQVEGGAQIAAGAAISHVLGAAGAEVGADRGGEVGVGQIGAPPPACPDWPPAPPLPGDRGRDPEIPATRDRPAARRDPGHPAAIVAPRRGRVCDRGSAGCRRRGWR